MKLPRIAYAIGYMDDNLISGANRPESIKRFTWIKWGAIAACFTIALIAVFNVFPILFNSNDTISPVGTENTETSKSELYLEKYYDYKICDGKFSSYIPGKVIEEGNIGSQLENVTVAAGWKNIAGKWVSETENLRGEVYEINGVSTDIAVALRFIDQGEAITTTHYYVIMNPNADLTVVEDYIISPIVPNNPGDGMVNE